MPMLTSTLNAEFEPVVGPFNVEVSGGVAALQRKNAAASPAFTTLVVLENRCGVVDNDVAGAIYRFTPVTPSVVVRADQ